MAGTMEGTSRPTTRSAIEIADIVESINGRDAGKLFIVIGIESQYSFLADGKRRRFEKPKKKKNKHIEPRSKADYSLLAKLIGGEGVTNNEIRRALAKYVAAHG